MDTHPFYSVPFTPILVDGRWEGTCACGQLFTGATADDVEMAQDEHMQNLPGFED